MASRVMASSVHVSTRSMVVILCDLLRFIVEFLLLVSRVVFEDFGDLGSVPGVHGLYFSVADADLVVDVDAFGAGPEDVLVVCCGEATVACWFCLDGELDGSVVCLEVSGSAEVDRCHVLSIHMVWLCVLFQFTGVCMYIYMYEGVFLL